MLSWATETRSSVVVCQAAHSGNTRGHSAPDKCPQRASIDRELIQDVKIWRADDRSIYWRTCKPQYCHRWACLLALSAAKMTMASSVSCACFWLRRFSVFFKQLRIGCWDYTWANDKLLSGRMSGEAVLPLKAPHAFVRMIIPAAGRFSV